MENVTLNKYFNYGCSLAPSARDARLYRPFDQNNYLVCCDADWEMLYLPNVYYIIVDGDTVIANGFSNLCFHELVHLQDSSGGLDPHTRDYCLSYERGPIIDVYLLPEDDDRILTFAREINIPVDDLEKTNALSGLSL